MLVSIDLTIPLLNLTIALIFTSQVVIRHLSSPRPSLTLNVRMEHIVPALETLIKPAVLLEALDSQVVHQTAMQRGT